MLLGASWYSIDGVMRLLPFAGRRGRSLAKANGCNFTLQVVEEARVAVLRSLGNGVESRCLNGKVINRNAGIWQLGEPGWRGGVRFCSTTPEFVR